MRRWVLLSLILGACGGGLPAATPADAARAKVQLADLQAGRSLVMAKCSACHAPPFPSAHTAAEWPRSIDQMADRSHLSGEDHRQIELYFATMTTTR